MASTFLICIEDVLIALDVFEAVSLTYPEAQIETDVQLSRLDKTIGSYIGPVCLITQWARQPVALRFDQAEPIAHIHIGDPAPPTANHVVSIPFSDLQLTSVLRKAMSASA